MARDSSLPVRKAIISTLKADADLTALVPVARIYGVEPPANPTWPFTRYGFASQLPLRASCMDGATIVGSVHAFAKGPGEDAVSAIAAAIARALDGKVLTLSTPYPATAHITWTGSQILRDTDEAAAYHAVVNFEASVAS